MGRPREFDPGDAIEDILGVFWRLGYEGTSLHELERATGLKRQSLYRVFGDKRSMYLAALAAYDEREIAEMLDAMAEARDGHARFERLFSAAIDRVTGAGDRRGCFLCNASVDQATLDAKTKNRISRMVGRLEDAFDNALADMPPFDKSAGRRRRMARKLLAGYFGLRVLIKCGAAPAALHDVRKQMLAELR